MADIIDQLSESIRKFAVTSNQERFDDELDFIMGKMKNVEIDEVSDEHWDTLRVNYTRLKYLNEIINHFNLPTEGKFIESIKKFMDSIDKKTLFYLQEINWYGSEPEFLDDSMKIKEFLEESLNENEPFKRLNSVVKGYKILVDIVEDMRNEKCEAELDPSFLDEFAPPKKRAKN
jgi:hypothetical protein